MIIFASSVVHLKKQMFNLLPGSHQVISQQNAQSHFLPTSGYPATYFICNIAATQTDLHSSQLLCSASRFATHLQLNSTLYHESDLIGLTDASCVVSWGLSTALLTPSFAHNKAGRSLNRALLPNRNNCSYK